MLCRFCRNVADSYANAIQMEKDEIDVEKAKEQHENYVKTLKRIGIEVIEVDAENNCPDCVFIEDPAIVVSPECIITT